MADDARTQYAEALAEWTELRAAAMQIEDQAERAATLAALRGERPIHPYYGGISLAAVARGNRRMLAPIRARHAEAKGAHAEAVEALAERRTKAREIKDPSERAKALDGLRGERPTHPTLVAAGCAVVAAVVGWPLLDGHRGAVAGGAVALWLITALILGQQTPAAKGVEKTSTEAPKEPPAEAAPATAPTPAEARLAVATLGSSGTHVALTAVTARLATAHPHWARSGKATKALLQEVGIRVRDGVKVDGTSVPGIHHDDVPPLPSPAGPPSGDVVVAGQSNNNNHNNADRPPSRAGFTSQPDPDNPARTIIVPAA